MSKANLKLRIPEQFENSTYFRFQISSILPLRVFERYFLFVHSQPTIVRPCKPGAVPRSFLRRPRGGNRRGRDKLKIFFADARPGGGGDGLNIKGAQPAQLGAHFPPQKGGHKGPAQRSAARHHNIRRPPATQKYIYPPPLAPLRRQLPHAEARLKGLD